MRPTTERLADLGMIRRWSGVVPGPDQLAGIEDFADPAFAAGLAYLIVDYRAVTLLDLTNAEIRKAAERARVLGPERRVALIAASDVIFGLARMFETTSELLADGRRYAVHVVRSADDAVEWLQRELPDIDFSQTRTRLLA